MGLDPSIRFGSRAAARGPAFVLNGPNDAKPVLGYSLDVRSPQSTTIVSQSTWITRDNEPDSSAFKRGAVMSESDRYIFDYRNHALTG